MFELACIIIREVQDIWIPFSSMQSCAKCRATLSFGNKYKYFSPHKKINTSRYVRPLIVSEELIATLEPQTSWQSRTAIKSPRSLIIHSFSVWHATPIGKCKLWFQLSTARIILQNIFSICGIYSLLFVLFSATKQIRDCLVASGTVNLTLLPYMHYRSPHVLF